jgi:hypothetical protein
MRLDFSATSRNRGISRGSCKLNPSLKWNSRYGWQFDPPQKKQKRYNMIKFATFSIQVGWMLDERIMISRPPWQMQQASWPGRSNSPTTYHSWMHFWIYIEHGSYPCIHAVCMPNNVHCTLGICYILIRKVSHGTVIWKVSSDTIIIL